MSTLSFADASVRVERLVKSLFENVTFVGDRWTLIVDGAVVYVRVRQHTNPPPGGHAPPIVKVASPVLKSVPRSSTLLDRLNTVNSQLALGRVYWHEGIVIMETTFLAETIQPFDIEASVSLIGGFSGDYAAQIQDSFGGEPIGT